MKGIRFMALILPSLFLGCGSDQTGESSLHENAPTTMGTIEASGTRCAAALVAPRTALASLECLRKAPESEAFFVGESERLMIVRILGLDRSTDLVALRTERVSPTFSSFSFPKINWPDLPKVPDGGISDRLKDLAKNLSPADWIAKAIKDVGRKVAAKVAAQTKEGAWTTTSCLTVGASAILLPAAGYIAPACAASGFITAGIGVPACVTAVSSGVVAATCVVLCETNNLADCR